MKCNLPRMSAAISVACLLALGFGARADEGAMVPAATTPDATAVVTTQQGTESLVTAFGAISPVPAETLNSYRAKANLQVDKIQINTNDLSAVMTENVATGNQTGHNTVSDGAFSDSAGFMTTIQNTGNNVLIQNATIINVSVEP